MEKSYLETTKYIRNNIKILCSGINGTMQEFSSLAQSIIEEVILDELISRTIGLYQRCYGYILFHVRTLVYLGVTKEELEKNLSLAIYMERVQSSMYTSDAMQTYEHFSGLKNT